MAHGVLHGAARALTVAHLCLSHKMDLREMALGFPMADEILDDIDIRRLIAEFSNHAEVIAAVVNVEQVIRDTPFRSRLCTSL